VISDGDDTNSTKIAEAIQKGYKQVGEKINTMDNKTLLQLTTASRNEASVAERARISKELQDADTVFYSINPTGSGIELSKNGMFGQANMQAFATQTGGTAFLPKFAPTETKDSLQNDSNIRKNQAALDQIFKQIASELRVAREIQMGMLPHDFAKFEQPYGVTFGAVLEPAREVGGDLYGVCAAGPERLMIFLGDVSGNGISRQ